MVKKELFLGDEKAEALLRKVQAGFRHYWGKSSVEILKKHRKQSINQMGA